MGYGVRGMGYGVRGTGHGVGVWGRSGGRSGLGKLLGKFASAHEVIRVGGAEGGRGWKKGVGVGVG